MRFPSFDVELEEPKRKEELTFALQDSPILFPHSLLKEITTRFRLNFPFYLFGFVYVLVAVKGFC